MWEKGKEGETICLLCARSCRLKDGEKGFCQVRINRRGELFTLNYGYAGSLNVDPIEKKPLYHFLPSSQTFSIGAPGCDFDCLGCQNHELSRPGPSFKGAGSMAATPEDMAKVAKESGARSISFTYSEPTVFYEFARDVGVLAKEMGLPSAWVTNGFMSPRTLYSLEDHVRAMNIDLKGISEDFYREVTGGRLAPVKENIKRSFEKGIHVEVTTLLIPGLNDGERELNELSQFLSSISPSLPWHISRFSPLRKQRHLETTGRESLLKAREIGFQNGLKHVYIGNMDGPGYGDTLCPSCGKVLVRRRGFYVYENLLLKGGSCPACGEIVYGVWG
jgi:pyruvate formate lyase activating enzyme